MKKKYLFVLLAAVAVITGCTVNDTPDTVITPGSKPDVVVVPDSKPDVIITPPASTTG